MSTCEKCNASLEEEAEFCSECGNMVYETVFCPECGEKTNSKSLFCPKCGKTLSEETPEKPSTENEVEENFMSKPTSRFSKKSAVIALGSAAIIIVIAGIFLFNPFKSGSSDSILYIKDKEINFSFLSKIKPFEVTDKFLSTGDNVRVQEFTDLRTNYNYILYRDEGNMMFYPDDIDENDMASYYYRKLKADNTKSDAATRVDTDISIESGISISKDGSKAFYIKGSDRRLYYNDMKDKVKIDSDVLSFYVNAAADYIVYTKEDGTIYEKDIKNKKDKVKIDSESYIQQVIDDVNKIYYLKDGTLCLKERNKDKVVISSGIEYVVSVLDNTGCYYTKQDEVNVKLSDYVTDDLAAIDNAIVLPKEEDYQSKRLVQGWDGEYYETVTDWDTYYAESDKYNAKLQRDEYRYTLSNTEKLIYNEKLYYNDGKKETLITENISSITMGTLKSPIVLYTKKIKQDKKLKFSELNAVDDVATLIDESQTPSSDIYVAIKEVESNLNQSKAQSFRINYSGTALYYLDDFSETNYYGTLMEVKLDKGKLATPLKIDEDVNEYRFANESDSIIYFKDVKNSKGDMYQAGKTIATDVALDSVYSFKKSADLLYLTNYSDSSDNGTLELLKDGKTKKISEDVNSFVAENQNNIAYLLDYNIDKGKGDAKLFNNSDKPVEIDNDVSKLLWKFDFIDFSTDSYNYGW